MCKIVPTCFGLGIGLSIWCLGSYSTIVEYIQVSKKNEEKERRLNIYKYHALFLLTSNVLSHVNTLKYKKGHIHAEYVRQYCITHLHSCNRPAPSDSIFLESHKLHQNHHINACSTGYLRPDMNSPRHKGHHQIQVPQMHDYRQ